MYLEWGEIYWNNDTKWSLKRLVREVIRDGIVMGYGLDGLGSISCRERDFSLLHNIRAESWIHPAPRPMDKGISFPGG
jgi:hypothetical protein